MVVQDVIPALRTWSYKASHAHMVNKSKPGLRKTISPKQTKPQNHTEGVGGAVVPHSQNGYLKKKDYFICVHALSAYMCMPGAPELQTAVSSHVGPLEGLAVLSTAEHLSGSAGFRPHLSQVPSCLLSCH